MTDKLGWTSAALLKEGARLLKQYDYAKTQREKDQINGCFVSIQEVFLAKKETKEDE